MSGIVLYSGEYRNEGRRKKIILRINDNGVDREIVATAGSLRDRVRAVAADEVAAMDLSEQVQQATEAESARIRESTLSKEDKKKHTVALQSIESQKRILAQVRNRVASALVAEKSERLIDEYIATVEGAFGKILQAVK